MANMLIRTRHLECKHRVAVVVRVILFLGIPTVYLLFAVEGIAETEPSLPEPELHVSSRHLLALPESGGRNCTPAAILEFPRDGFTRYQRKHGFIMLHCLFAVYCFCLLGAVCEQYFVPAISLICERLSLAEDVAGATFMAAASSSPELFINCVGTFVTQGDLGVGAVVGSAVFNVLAVPACCGILAGKVIELDWWSVSRDCLMYAVSVVALILTLLDDRVYWQEALLLVLMYTGYILAMVFNGRLGNFAKSGCCGGKKSKLYTEITPLLPKEKSGPLDASRRLTNGSTYLNGSAHNGSAQNGSAHNGSAQNGSAHNGSAHSGSTQRDVEQAIVLNGNNDIDLESSSVWSWPGTTSPLQKLYWLVTWPIGLALWATIPDCRRRPRLYPLCFVMCIAWIGGVSYLVAWTITVLGDTLELPDSITGLTILAAGTSLPEAISSVVVTNQGHGSMGLSNSIGSNTFDILLCLGLPWLVKGLFYPAVPGNNWVSINSSGISYNAISLLSTLFALYGCLALNRFQLDWRIGLVCAAVYAGFLLLATLLELNVFFVVNLPVCPHV